MLEERQQQLDRKQRLLDDRQQMLDRKQQMLEKQAASGNWRSPAQQASLRLSTTSQTATVQRSEQVLVCCGAVLAMFSVWQDRLRPADG